MIVGSDIDENIGRFVNVGSRFTPFDPKYGVEWNCVSAGGPLRYFVWTNCPREMTMNIICSDSDLRPINPPADEATEQTTMPESEKV